MQNKQRRILITGASGLLGQALTRTFSENGDEVIPLLRGESDSAGPIWNPNTGHIDLKEIGALDAVIHLAGSNIAQGRWSPERKKIIRNSRIAATQLLSQALIELPEKPKTMISASAVGIYGNCGDVTVDEDTPVGQGFLANLCAQWEASTQSAEAAGIRVLHARIGVVLDHQGGALKKMSLPFRLGLGGTLGKGAQFMSWVSLRDVVGMMQFLIDHPALSGPFNLVSPHPVTNLVFTKALGHALRRPTVLPLPSFFMRLLFGEMADELFLSSTRAMPRRFLDAGYSFCDPDLALLLKEQVASISR
ncbi:MAG: TIGR01777 family protein [Planctomycetota bacterium]|nr:MAG: TIGR01777 family protein [Planctomycetota bacterium]